jgi:sialate O-acetylesterase
MTIRNHMKRNRTIHIAARIMLAWTLAALPGFVLKAQVRLPAWLCDGAVIQHGREFMLHGWASPGEKITVRLDGKKYGTRTGTDSTWKVTLPPQAPGGPHVLEFSGKNRIRVGEVLFGDVWICAGQSNMVLPLERVKEKYPGEPPGEGYPRVRHFFIPTATDLEGPRDDLPPGKWIRAVPGEAPGFSATAYFFGKEIHGKYGIPVGLINASVGGTPIEAWISEQGLEKFPGVLETVHRNRDRAWIDSLLAARPPYPSAHDSLDRGLTGEVPWFDPGYRPEGWQRINIPGYWEDQGIRNLDGVVWYRREIEVPASMTGIPAKLFMGRIVDADHVYVNGIHVGNITYQYPPRRYELPAGVLKPGKNLVVIRVINYNGKGGFVPDKPYELTAGGETLDLKGDWWYRVGEVFERKKPAGFRFSLQNQPTALYNAMVAPLAGVGARGFLWYQGESNTHDPGSYGDYLKALITDWRGRWAQGDLPFLYVQLANFMEVDYLPSESNWAGLREAQRGALSLPNTAMAVAIDLGEWNDIHPLNKEEVGKRLALGAMHLAYGEKELVYSGPLYRSGRVEGNRAILSFDHTGSGLVAKGGGELQRFGIAGEDGKFRWARARISGNTVEVWHESITEPREVRYAWADNPFGANLYNREGLPASPFRARFPSWRETYRRMQDSINRLSRADHGLMMDQLGIRELRPGPSGNPDAPDAANTDESLASPYESLPDPLTFNNGDPVTSPEQWDARRLEIMEDFDREVYGRVPLNTPAVKWELSEERDSLEGTFLVKVKRLTGRVAREGYQGNGVAIDLTLVTPLEAGGPVPVIMNLGFMLPPGWRDRMPRPHGPSWKEQLLAKGWGYAILVPTSIQADNGAGLTGGIIGLVNGGRPRGPEDWGALRAWAWGVSRAVDYFETDPAVDAERVGIEGLSRYGKAALVAMAYEPRIAIGFIGSSGAGGAKILRRVFGEQVENLASTYAYHWFAGNFIRYAGPLTPDDLPVDAHELVALCAPRPVFISAGSPAVEGQWVDAKGMFLAGVHAGPVYTLLGKGDLGTDEQPSAGTALTEGDIAWRQHHGGHTTGPNWPYFIRFAERYFNRSVGR